MFVDLEVGENFNATHDSRQNLTWQRHRFAQDAIDAIANLDDTLARFDMDVRSPTFDGVFENNVHSFSDWRVFGNIFSADRIASITL